MVSEVSFRRESDPVRQLSVFTDNRVGRLNELIQTLGHENIHIIALSQLDATECTIARLVVNYHEAACEVLAKNGYAYFETEIIAVELETEERLRHVTAALVEAEINIHYLYPFIVRPGGRSALAIHVEDNDLARDVLGAHRIRVLDQRDIAR